MATLQAHKDYYSKWYLTIFGKKHFEKKLLTSMLLGVGNEWFWEKDGSIGSSCLISDEQMIAVRKKEWQEEAEDREEQISDLKEKVKNTTHPFYLDRVKDLEDLLKRHNTFSPYDEYIEAFDYDFEIGRSKFISQTDGLLMGGSLIAHVPSNVTDEYLQVCYQVLQWVIEYQTDKKEVAKAKTILKDLHKRFRKNKIKNFCDSL